MWGGNKLAVHPMSFQDGHGCVCNACGVEIIGHCIPALPMSFQDGHGCVCNICGVEIIGQCIPALHMSHVLPRQTWVCVQCMWGGNNWALHPSIAHVLPRWTWVCVQHMWGGNNWAVHPSIAHVPCPSKTDMGVCAMHVGWK